MRVVLASNTPVVPDQSEFVVGKEGDNFRFQRKWCVPICLNLIMEDGDKPSDWAVVSKILTRISWNYKWLGIQLGKGDDCHKVKMTYTQDEEGNLQMKKFMRCFYGKKTPGTLYKYQLGKSTCFRFKEMFCYNDDEEPVAVAWASPDGYPFYCSNGNWEKTPEEILQFLTVEDEQVRISWWEYYVTEKEDPVSICKRILEAGFMADCKLVSNQGEAFSCHKVVLEDASVKLRAELAGGNAEIKVDVSSKGVDAFLRYLYYGDLAEARKDLAVSLELFKAAGALEVVKLWNTVAGVLMEANDLDMKTACDVFDILVKFKKTASAKKLAKKLVAVMTLTSTEGTGILHKYTRDRAFFDAWIALASASNAKTPCPPLKRERF